MSDGAEFTNCLKDMWCRGTESNCRHQPFQDKKKMNKIK